MQIKQIIGAILMIILTISGVVLGVLISINIDSNAITQLMVKSNYLEESEKEVQNVLKNYLTAEKAALVLENISVKSDICELVEALDNNTVMQRTEQIKKDMQLEITKVLDDFVDENTKTQFATTVSDVYVKTIFPVTEYNMLSMVYAKYSNVLKYICVALVILIIGIYIYLMTGKKTYKWNIIAIYNVVLINIILILLTYSFNNIVVGNERTTLVISNLISSIRNNLIVYIVFALILAGISNYIAYFRHKKLSR